MKVSNRKKVLFFAAIVAIAIILVTVVIPPIREYALHEKERTLYENILGFVPPWEEVEYQVIQNHTREGAIYPYPDFAAKYVITKEQLPQASELIQSATGTERDGTVEDIYKGGTTMWGDDVKGLNYSRTGPNRESSKDEYQDAWPVTWWDIEPDYISENIIEYYDGRALERKDVEEDYYTINIMFMPADENIYIYIYISLG